MATLQQESRGSKIYYRIAWMGPDKRRQRIRLGEMPEPTARFIFSQVDQLIAAQAVGQPLNSRISKWLDKLSDDLHGKLALVGLCQERRRSTLAQFIDDYIASREDGATNTIRNWKNSRRKLTDYFGEQRDFHTISEGDADDWRQNMVNAKLSPSTISKAVKHAKQFAQAAVRKGYIDRNPFAGLTAGGERNDERKHFVSRENIAKALAEAPGPEWRAIIALSRFGGLRCPSEVLALRWTDINWDRGTITITSKKTKRFGKGFRVVPLFPELREVLTEAQEAAPVGADYVISRYRDTESNLRTHFHRILKRAGVEPWPKTFHNMRASRQTELANQFPAHVVCDWMGNSQAVARDHYLQTTDDHITQATAGSGAQRGATGSVGHDVGQKISEAIRSESQASPGKMKKGQALPTPLQREKHPLGEMNDNAKSLSVMTPSDGVGHSVGQLPDDCLTRLIAVWDKMKPTDRAWLADWAETLARDASKEG